MSLDRWGGASPDDEVTEVTQILALIEQGDAQVDDSICKLAEDDPISAEIVKLRLFAGMSVDEAARSLCISRSAAYRHWTYARAWLIAERQG